MKKQQLIFGILYITLINTSDANILKNKINPQNYYTPAADVLQIYQMMKDTHEILQKYNIEYWIHAGTLLGAERNKGLIPWDDDTDICIKTNQKNEFYNLKSIFNKLNYEVIPYYFGFKIFPMNGRLTEYSFKYPWIDVMCWAQVDDKFMYDPKINPGPWYDTIFIAIKDLYPLKKYLFGEIYVMGPQNPYPYLNYVYPQWNEIFTIQNHQINLQDKIILTAEYRRCARPMGPLENKIIP